MYFKKLNFIILLFFILLCKNPYLFNPVFNPSMPELNSLPIKESDVAWMQPFGNVDYGTKTAYHSGFDFGMKTAITPFYSCGDGVVSEVNYNTGEGLPGTNYRIVIQVSARVFLDYHFEIGGSVSEEQRKQNIFVKQGDYIKAGTKIANLISLVDYAHVDFGIKLDESRNQCPLIFFSKDTASKLENLFDSVEKRPVRDNLCE